MKTHIHTLRVILAAPLLAIVAACPAAPPAPEPVDPAITISESGAFLDGWLAAREAGNGDNLTPMYYGKTGFIWVEEGRTMYTVGEDAAAALDIASTAGYTPRLSFGAREITPLAPNVAAVSADYTQTLELGGLKVETDGIFTGVLVNEEGQWKFVQGHFSTPMTEAPPAVPAPAADTVTAPVTEPVTSEPAVPPN